MVFLSSLAEISMTNGILRNAVRTCEVFVCCRPAIIFDANQVSDRRQLQLFLRRSMSCEEKRRYSPE